ncbi:MAG TPA: hypothetical protein VFM55_21010 [Micromonosporaceae bacterium]|nr:hypothetical protein [Micromonosporaceae bacterium]
MRAAGDSVLRSPRCRVGAIETANGRVSSLVTKFCPPGLAIDQVRPLLDPGNWPRLCDLWRSMERLEPVEPTGPRRYLEVMGQPATDGWQLRTCLEFVLRERATGTASLGYRLSTDQTEGDGRVVVDEGSILVRRQGDRVCVTTAKRLRFAGLNLPASVAVVMRALGYAAIGEDMVLACASLTSVASPRPDRLRPGPQRRPGPPRAAGVGSGAGRLEAFLDDLASITVTALAERATGLARSAGRVVLGRAPAEDMIRDGVQAGMGSVGDFSQALGAATRAARGQGHAAARRPVGSDRLVIPGARRMDALAVLGPLVGDFADEIPASDVSIVPAGHVKGFPAVRLLANVTSAHVGSYWGEVGVMSSGAAVPVETIPVELVVP